MRQIKMIIGLGLYLLSTGAMVALSGATLVPLWGDWTILWILGLIAGSVIGSSLLWRNFE
jgi:hypothetical protein